MAATAPIVSPNTYEKRVVEWFRTNYEWICDTCVASKLGFTNRIQLRNICSTLRCLSELFEWREHGHTPCDFCGRRNIVTRWRRSSL